MENKIMAKLWVILILIFETSKISSQNLVVNPGFEEFKNKPSLNESNLPFYTNWNFDYLKHDGIWATYFLFFEPKKSNKCWKYLSIPTPRSGNAMAGIWPEFYSWKKWPKVGEKLQGELLKELIPNQSYCVKFYFYYSEQSWEPSEELGIYFYNEGEFPTDKFPDKRNLKANPQLTISDSSLSISGKWHCFSMLYKAHGGEKYFLVGNFKEKKYLNYDETPWLNKKTKTGNHAGIKMRCYNVTMYYFDDFEISPVSDENNKCN